MWEKSGVVAASLADWLASRHTLICKPLVDLVIWTRPSVVCSQNTKVLALAERDSVSLSPSSSPVGSPSSLSPDFIVGSSLSIPSGRTLRYATLHYTTKLPPAPSPASTDAILIRRPLSIVFSCLFLPHSIAIVTSPHPHSHPHPLVLLVRIIQGPACTASDVLNPIVHHSTSRRGDDIPVNRPTRTRRSHGVHRRTRGLWV